MESPKYISKETYEEINNLGWEWQNGDEDEWGSFHFMIVLDEGEKNSGITMDYFPLTAEHGMLFVAEFEYGNDQSYLENLCQSKGTECRFENLRNFVMPYIQQRKRYDSQRELHCV